MWSGQNNMYRLHSKTTTNGDFIFSYIILTLLFGYSMALYLKGLLFLFLLQLRNWHVLSLRRKYTYASIPDIILGRLSAYRSVVLTVIAFVQMPSYPTKTAMPIFKRSSVYQKKKVLYYDCSIQQLWKTTVDK